MDETIGDNMYVAQHNNVLSTEEINQILNIPMYLLHNEEGMAYMVYSVLGYDFDVYVNEVYGGVYLTFVDRLYKNMYARIHLLYKLWYG